MATGVGGFLRSFLGRVVHNSRKRLYSAISGAGGRPVASGQEKSHR